MLDRSRSPMTSHESSLIRCLPWGTSGRETIAARRDQRAARDHDPARHRATRTPAKIAETRKPPSASAEVALGNNVAQQPIGRYEQFFARPGEAPLWMKALTALQIAMFQPAEAVRTGDFFGGLEHVDTVPPRPPSA